MVKEPPGFFGVGQGEFEGEADALGALAGLGGVGIEEAATRPGRVEGAEEFDAGGGEGLEGGERLEVERGGGGYDSQVGGEPGGRVAGRDGQVEAVDEGAGEIGSGRGFGGGFADGVDDVLAGGEAGDLANGGADVASGINVDDVVPTRGGGAIKLLDGVDLDAGLAEHAATEGVGKQGQAGEEILGGQARDEEPEEEDDGDGPASNIVGGGEERGEEERDGEQEDEEDGLAHEGNSRGDRGEGKGGRGGWTVHADDEAAALGAALGSHPCAITPAWFSATT